MEINISSGRLEKIIAVGAVFAAAVASYYSYIHGYIISYGDAESHLNIAKRVIDSLTPGLAQLGGIWLPLPHLFLVPFVYFNFLWRTGLAGSIVSGVMYVIACVYIYKLTYFATENKLASFLSAFIFGSNLNILYLQTTPMTEMSLIAFFVLSTYYFVKFLKTEDLLSLIFAACFTFCATLTRYDGWFLALAEAGIIALTYITNPAKRETVEGKLLLFSTLAFFGVALWFLWDLAILGNPFYFTDSPFSAKSQQNGWMARGELPAYHNVFLSLLYYAVTVMRNSGTVLAALAIIGLIVFMFSLRRQFWRIYILALLLVPFVFYVVTLYLGQSIIFIPDLTPKTFEWRLFNVRYGVVMIPSIAFFVGYLFYKSRTFLKPAVLILIAFQMSIIVMGSPRSIVLEDGVNGLSASKKPDAEYWFAKNYDKGLVLIDDYARTMSITRSRVPMRNVIYVGNKPYWDDSLRQPAKYATWIVMQKHDTVWTRLYDDTAMRGQVFKYFQKVYTSPDILIFKRAT